MAIRVLNRKPAKGSQQEILQRVKKGDEKAFEWLYKKHYKIMVRLIMRNGGSESEGQDVYQEALISLWRRIRSGKLEIYSKISTYLYSVCLNLWRKELGRKKKMLNENHLFKKTEEVVDTENREVVEQCLSRLDNTCKKILMCYYFDGMKMQDIASEFNFASANTAKTKKYKCKEKLKKLIELKYVKKDLLD